MFKLVSDTALNYAVTKLAEKKAKPASLDLVENPEIIVTTSEEIVDESPNSMADKSTNS